HFESDHRHPSEYVSIPGQPIGAHIEDLWPVLTRAPERHPRRGTLLALPRRYLVPGGRFGELYYWDSYFTMVGLGPRHAALPGDAAGRVVRLPDGALLNRYWDDRDTPREEAWLEDVETARACSRPAAEVFRDLRAACESGWDFSTRWLHESAPRCAPPAVHR